ncbi:Mitochondrial beta-keto-acyl synthase [Blastocladiella emersonii ATCC 22665]|nr:Mitochondrial beta-keto-acyl synthase [Blastocladiella emersonii ATCC 22665]
MTTITLRKVAVTGIGLVTPLGVTASSTWQRLTAAESGLVDLRTSPHGLRGADFASLPCTVAGVVPRADLDPASFLAPGDDRKTSLFIQYALRAAREALADAAWRPDTDADCAATGVAIGSGIGGVDEFAAADRAVASGALRKVSPFAVPKALVNMAAGWVSLTHGFTGPNLCSGAACAAGAHSIADAARIIATGEAKVMVAGAAESTISPLCMTGFARAKALTTSFNDDPTAASRPFDAARSGFVMGEGAGILILEDLEHALARGAPTIYAILAGAGASADAHHITSPPPDGAGAARAMAAALQRAVGDQVSRVGYVNAHATSTELGDVAEIAAVRKVFGGHATSGLRVSSTKGAMGHLLGGAGAAEAAVAVLALHHGVIPPTLNLRNPDPATAGIDLVPLTAVRDANLAAVMSNSFGFGGTNASLVFTKPE